MHSDKLSIVLSTHATQFNALAYSGDFEANIAKIATIGYRGVELAIRDPSVIDLGMLEKLINQHGLKIAAIGTGQAWVEEGLSFTDVNASVRMAAVGRIKAHIELARRFDALVVVGLIRGKTARSQTYEESMRLLIDCLSECVEVALHCGVRMVLEPLNRYETNLVLNVGEGMELLRQVGSSSLGLLLDTFHMNIEEPIIDESIHKAGDSVFHFHVADSDRWYPGAGHLDFRSILSTLSKTGYRGWISGEFMPYPDADTAAQRCFSYLEQLDT